MQPPDQINAQIRGCARTNGLRTVRPDYAAGVVLLRLLGKNESSIFLGEVLRFLVYDSRMVLAKKIADNIVIKDIDQNTLEAVLLVYTTLNDVENAVKVFERVKYMRWSEKAYVLMIDMYIKGQRVETAYEVCKEYNRVFGCKSLNLEKMVVRGYAKTKRMKECWDLVREYGPCFEFLVILYSRLMDQRDKRFIAICRREGWIELGLNAVLFWHARREEWADVEKVYMGMILEGVGVRKNLSRIVARVIERGEKEGVGFTDDEKEVIERMGRDVEE